MKGFGNMADVDSDLEHFLRHELNDGSLALERCPMACISRIYRARLSDGRRLFVKWGFAMAECATEFLRLHTGHALLPPLVTSRIYMFDGHPVSIFNWRDVVSIPVERMNDAQYASLLGAKDELSRLLNEPMMAAYMRSYAARQEERIDPDVRGPAVRPVDCLKTVRSFVTAHPWTRHVLRSLLEIDETLFKREPQVSLVVNHGDFHAGNLGFEGNRLAVFFDFDNLAWEFPIEDMVRLFSESFQDGTLAWHPLLRRRLARRFAAYVRSMKRPPSEWQFAIDRFRLYYARNTLSRHFGQARVAVRVAERDRRLRKMLAIVREVVVS